MKSSYGWPPLEKLEVTICDFKFWTLQVLGNPWKSKDSRCFTHCAAHPGILDKVVRSLTPNSFFMTQMQFRGSPLIPLCETFDQISRPSEWRELQAVAP